MLSIESYVSDVYQAPKEEQLKWANLLSEHYSTDEKKYPPQYFLDFLDKQGERSFRLKKTALEAYKEAYGVDYVHTEREENKEDPHYEIYAHLDGYEKANPSDIDYVDKMVEEIAEEAIDLMKAIDICDELIERESVETVINKRLTN